MPVTSEVITCVSEQPATIGGSTAPFVDLIILLEQLTELREEGYTPKGKMGKGRGGSDSISLENYRVSS